MANIRCKVCGKTYNYEQEGMCPKCGAYNRPPRRERVDPDGTVHELRESENGTVPNHPGKKACYEEQVRMLFSQGARQAAAKLFPKKSEKKRERQLVLLFVGVVALLTVIGNLELGSRTPDDTAVEQASKAEEIFCDYVPGTWSVYDGEGNCHPGQRFEVEGTLCCLRTLRVSDGYLSVRIDSYPEDAIRLPELNVTCIENDGSVTQYNLPVWGTDDQNRCVFTYDLSMLPEAVRDTADGCFVAVPVEVYADGGEVVVVDISEALEAM